MAPQKIYFKKGTLSQIEAAAAAGGLHAGEPYFVSSAGKIAFGLSANIFKVLANQEEVDQKINASLFQNLSSGLHIIQWINGSLIQIFSTVTSMLEQRVYFPVAFPTTCGPVLISRASSPVSTHVWMRDYPSDSTGSFVIKKTTTGNERFNIFAGGY